MASPVATDGSEASYVFHDGLGNTHMVHGTGSAISALMVVFVRRDALELIYSELADVLDIVKPMRKEK